VISRSLQRLFGAHRALRLREWLLEEGEIPPLAAHLLTVRCGYVHHGIHVGEGKVVHYAGLSRGWRAAPVEQVPLRTFARGRSVWVRSHANPRFDCDEIMQRARSRMGECGYKILSNNCEHFCEWCIQGESRSRQVETLRQMPRRVLLAVLRVVVVGSHALFSWQAEPDNWAV
jgi:HRAS-like suppressor 3